MRDSGFLRAGAGLLYGPQRHSKPSLPGPYLDVMFVVAMHFVLAALVRRSAHGSVPRCDCLGGVLLRLARPRLARAGVLALEAEGHDN